MIKNIVFDFGGVLIDWDPTYLYKNVFEDRSEMDYFLENVCNHHWNLKQDTGRSFAEATEELLEKFPKYRNEIEMYYNNWTSMLGGAFNKNVALIEPLKKKYKLYGLTNWSAETFPIAQQLFPFLNEMEGIVVSGEEKLIKPDQRIYQLLLQRYKLNASECLFIDDNKNNILAAKKIGFQTIHFTDGVNLKQELQKLNIL